MPNFVDPRVLFQKARLRRLQILSGMADLGSTATTVGGGAAAGAAAGAMYGSTVPIIGTAIGAGVGAIGGAVASALEGGSSHADRVKKAAAQMAILQSQANARGNAVTQRLAIGTLQFYPGDYNWAYDPNGDWSILLWAGTGKAPTTSMFQLTSDIPEGYVPTGVSSIQGVAAVRWQGDGPSPVMLLMRQQQSDTAASVKAAAAATAAQNQAAQQSANQASQIQAALDGAITQADIQRKSGDYDGALMTLNNSLATAQQVPDGISRVQSMISQVSAEKVKVQTAAATKSDAQQALNDALDSAQATAKRGNFDDADNLIQGAKVYARAVGGFAVNAQINDAQIYVDNLRNDAANAAKAQQDAAAQAAVLAAQKAANAQQVATIQAAATAYAAPTTITSAPAAPPTDTSAMQMQMQMMLQQMMQSQGLTGGLTPGFSMPTGMPNMPMQQPQQAPSPDDSSGGFSTADAAGADSSGDDSMSDMSVSTGRSSGFPWKPVLIGSLALFLILRARRRS